MAEKSLNGDKQRKGNRKRSSHKANSDDKNKVTTILGNSRISEDEDYRIFKKLSNQKHVVVKSFASSKVECLSPYAKPKIIVTKTRNHKLP